ncbi:MAG: type secretion system protein [Pseudomonadota bacterium]
MLARTPRHTPRHSHGMTLIELIVAIALLALVTLIAYRGLSLLERSNQQLTHESERWQDIALFFARFGNDVTQPSARPIHIGTTQPTPGSSSVLPTLPTPNAPGTSAGATLAAANAIVSQNLMSALGANADVSNAPSLPAWQGRRLPERAASDSTDQADLEFTRKSAPGRDEIRIGYRLRGSRLELLIWPALDRAPHTIPEIYPLLDDVAALHLRYMDAAGLWQERWPVSENWNHQSLLPRGVEIEITLHDGTRLTRVFALPS